MMNSIFTRITQRLQITLVILLGLALSHSIVAQIPSCTCKPSVQVSIGSSGTVEITPSMILADGSTCGGGGTVTVMTTPTGTPIAGSPFLNCSHVGKTLYAKVANAGNSCWSSLIIEDKLKPIINCPTAPLVLTCVEMEDFELSVTENCVNYTTNVVNEVITVNNCGVLADNVLKQIERTYTATDAFGNISLPCVVTFNVTTIDDLEDIDIPENLMVSTANALTCDFGFGSEDWAPMSNGNPNPESVYDEEGELVSLGTGVPTLEGIALFNNPDAFCNLMVSYTDTRVKVGCVTKVMRTWNIIEWSCLNRSRDPELQIIEIEDKFGPILSGATNLTATTSDHSCLASVNFNQANLTVVDACSSTTTLDINVFNAEDDTPVGVIKHGAVKVLQLPVGLYYATYTGYDACGKSSSVTINLEVFDHTPPVAICNDTPTVALTNDGSAWVSATVFDDGSYDECTLGKLLVRRMDAPHCSGCEAPEFPGFLPLGEYVNADGVKHYYYLSQHSSMPDVAYKTAKAMGGYIVSYENNAEGSWVHTQAYTYLPDTEDRFLTGMNDLLTENTFVWASGKSSTYTPTWASGEPDGSGDYVVHRRNNRFRDIGSDEGILRYIVEIADPCGFSSHVQFCCADVNTTSNKMVVLRAIDASGNYNDCMVNAQIQDKLRPSLTCPEDVTIHCDVTYDIENLGEEYGEAFAIDNCDTPLVIELDPEVEVTGCRTGSITRTFQVTDAGGFIATCSQVIEIVANPELVYNGPTVSEWPENVTVVGCGDPNHADFAPEATGAPVLSDGSCSLVGAQKSDQTFNFNNSNGIACFKILRTWTVIDWCKFAPNVDENGDEYPDHKVLFVNTWEKVQEIKVVDNDAPEFEDLEPVVSVDTYDADCLSGDITLSASAEDVCTDVLRYAYKIDLGNDGSFLPEVKGNGNEILVEGSYPVGQHRISYTFEDKCGNIATRDQIFNIVNKKSPNAYVKNGLAMSLMPVGNGEGMAEIWASDFDNGSTHPCGYKVYFSFTEVTQLVNGVPVTTPNWVFSCDDVKRNFVDVWVVSVTPSGDIVQSVVNTFIDIQDNNDVCDSDDGGRVVLNGSLQTESNIPVMNVEVELKGSELRDLTGNDGAFVFGDMPQGGSYQVAPFKNDDWKNGVSTLDLVLIQRHILNVEAIASPYRLIAADANKDKKITVLDLSDLRKLILGYNDDIASNTSWRFVDKNYQFTDVAEAYREAFPEVYSIEELRTNMTTDFTAIKIGDINGSAKANNFNQTESRSNQALALTTVNKAFSKGDLVSVPVKTGNDMMLSGIQFTFQYDPTMLEFIDIEKGKVSIESENIHVFNNGNGTLTLSWNASDMIHLNQNDELFSIVLKSKNNGTIAESVSVNSSMISAEAYDDALNIRNIKWSVEGNENMFAVYQNNPNPFKALTNISFELPEALMTNISIHDVTGRLISTQSVQGTQGLNTIQISLNQQITGVLYYTVTAGKDSATRKMIVIE